MAAVAWCLSLIMLKKRDGRLDLRVKEVVTPILFVGAMILGALQPTNTWDYLTFTALAMCVLVYIGWRYLPEVEWRFLLAWSKKWVTPVLSSVSLFLLTRIFYFNFNRFFFPGYNSIGFWSGDKTPLKSYLMHWGLILFVITCWLVWETYQWMASTRISQLETYKRHRDLLIGLIVLIGVAFLVLLLLKVTVTLVALPLCLLALILILTTEDDLKRLAYFMIGTGLLLTLVVELVYLVGDIGRMNVVFKLYHQAWMLLTLPMGLAVATLWRDLNRWRSRTQIGFQVVFTVLFFIALLFPVLATKDKITDRMDPSAPKSLDGMKYMETSQFAVNGVVMDLGQDYRAIQWMQKNVEGSPVILEAQAYEYYWGNRYTIYTGLPGVVGWNYHQRQQRAVLRNNAVQERVDEVNAFYLSLDQGFVTNYLEKYDIKYIIVGQQEQAFYPAETLEKFETYDGTLWDMVYNEGDTVIYKVR
jgi:YYY domain-containing protein